MQSTLRVQLSSLGDELFTASHAVPREHGWRCQVEGLGRRRQGCGGRLGRQSGQAKQEAGHRGSSGAELTLQQQPGHCFEHVKHHRHERPPACCHLIIMGAEEVDERRDMVWSARSRCCCQERTPTCALILMSACRGEGWMEERDGWSAALTQRPLTHLRSPTS